MQFIPNGPDIPERLLQAHEDGRVVFFCGAGISYPAGLPGFEELTREIFKRLHQKPNDIQRAAMKAKQFDTAIGLLEAKIVGERRTVRETLAQILTPNLYSLNAIGASKAIATHEALLTLGKCRNDDEDQTRLVTTNYDRLFEKVIDTKRLQVESFPAPLLPILKDSWSGLVYLHGLLTVDPKPSELNRLIVSSGDFGRAYLTEGWATRFVSELFRNYSVCFVGYSINDPVLRHMVDALAADRLQGESPPEMFAFGSYSKNKKEERAKEWEAKNVTPILYPAYRHHFYLHRTLKVWAETYRDGIQGKERIVAECAMKDPLENTTQDDFVGRLLWALSDPSGLPAKHFANMNPVPSLDWLVPLSEARHLHADLSRFGVPPMKDLDKELAFSLIHRPSPYPLAQWMTVVDQRGIHHSQWDAVIPHLAYWLTRHLNDPKLLLWLAKRGGQLHVRLAIQIEKRLDELSELKHDGNEAKITRILEDAPNAMPSSSMQILWQLLLTGRVQSQMNRPYLFWWSDSFKRDGLTVAWRLKLLELLMPRVSLSEPFRGPAENGGRDKPTPIHKLVDWKIVFSTEYAHSCLDELQKNEHWVATLPDLLSDFSALLRDALDLMRELNGADDRSDPSFTHQPSISEHPQNGNTPPEWTALIRLTRDAWLGLVAQSPERAAREAESWWNVPYPLFRRLSFFAATQNKVIPHRQALNWLLADDHWWLWAEETKREALRLLVALAPQLDKEMLAELEQAILAGPPPNKSERDTSPEDRQREADREIWLRLAKIQQTNTPLSPLGQERLDALSAQYPKWKLAEDESDEFFAWVRSSSLDGGDEGDKLVATPQRRRKLIEWLKQHPDIDPWHRDDWRQRCRNNFPTTACALCALAKEDNWPIGRWNEALDTWSESELIKRSWHYMAPVIANAPDEVIQKLAHTVSRWLRVIANTFEGHEELFLSLISRILKGDHQDGIDTKETLFSAINHPIGRATWALLDWWSRGILRDEQGLSDEARQTFTELSDTHAKKYRPGRVLLAVHAITLFRVDPAWTKQHLLPLFNWQSCETEALAAWSGFLWSPRRYRPLMEAIKSPFLDTAKHYDTLANDSRGEQSRQYVDLLTLTALDLNDDTFKTAELRRATHVLPQAGINNVAQTLIRALEGAGEKRAEYWTTRIAPYLEAIWPKAKDYRSPAIAGNLGYLCIAAQEAFPKAFSVLKGWLEPIGSPTFLIRPLHEKNLCQQFPEPSLAFLALVIVKQEQQLIPDDLKKCLKQIQEAEPKLVEDKRYIRLSDYLRRYR